MGSRVSLLVQEVTVRSLFPKSRITRHWEDEFIWVGELQPTPLSNTYKVKLHYKRGKFIKISVIEPKLKLAKGKLVLPHVYSTPKQELCLYLPNNNEWDAGMLYIHSLIPWASEWLYHYEIWVGSGEWHGGGVDHEQLEVI